MQSYNYTITLTTTEKKYLLFKTSLKDALCQVKLKFVHWIWIRRFLNFVNFFRFFVIISNWKRAQPFIWKNWMPYTKECFMPSLVEISALEKNILKFRQCILPFLYHLPLERGVASIWTNWNPLYPRMFCAKFGWNWSTGSEENVCWNCICLWFSYCKMYMSFGRLLTITI